MLSSIHAAAKLFKNYVHCPRTTSPKELRVLFPVVSGGKSSRIRGCSNIYDQLSIDYAKIATDVADRTAKREREQIKTCSGELLQIRTKDGKPYKPLLGPDGIQVRDKQMAFYLRTRFVETVIQPAPDALIK